MRALRTACLIVGVAQLGGLIGLGIYILTYWLLTGCIWPCG